MENKKTTVFKVAIKCPHCDKSVLVKKQKELVNEPISAEYKEKLIIEKDTQTKLNP